MKLKTRNDGSVRVLNAWEVYYRRAGKKMSRLCQTKTEAKLVGNYLKYVDRRKLLGVRQVQLAEVVEN